MTTYNTGNPIGSTEVKDLYDNAQNLDELVNNRTARSYDDRLGVARKTWWGMEQDFQDFLIKSGYEIIGDYAAGLEITARNQIFWKDGELYRAGAVLELPYITTGDWVEEEALFVTVGDQVLRDQLADADGPANGASMVGYQPSEGAPTTVDAALKAAEFNIAKIAPNIREKLGAPRTYFVSPTGNDTNTGMSTASPMQTIQAAYDKIVNTLDFAGNPVTIQMMDGVYTTGLVANTAGIGQMGPSSLLLKGNTDNPNLTKLSTTGNCIHLGSGVSSGAMMSVVGFEVTSTTGSGLLCEGGSLVFGNIRFGPCAVWHVAASHSAFVIQNGDAYTIVGGAQQHAQAGTGATLALHGATVTFMGGPWTFDAFAQATSGGQLFVNSMTFINGPFQIGPRFNATSGGVITALTGDLEYLPGNQPGKALSGGYYDSFTIGEPISVLNVTTYIDARTRDFLVDASGGVINIILPPTTIYNAGMEFGFSRIDGSANPVSIYDSASSLLHTLPVGGFYRIRSYTNAWYRFG